MAESGPNDEPHAQSDAEPPAAATGPTTTRPMTSDDFLVPGPTPESNAGFLRWGLTWIVFSILVMGSMLLLTVACFGIAKLVGAA